MFGLGFSEVLVICVVALIVFGPERLPSVARTMGRSLAEFRRAFDEIKREISADAFTEELRRPLDPKLIAVPAGSKPVNQEPSAPSAEQQSEAVHQTPPDESRKS